MAKQEKETFYHAYHGRDHLDTGIKVTVEHSIEFNRFYDSQAELLELLRKPLKELQSMQKESIKQEQGIYKELQEVAVKWEKQASQTLLIEKAMEYLKTPEVEHTSNEWKKKKDDIWEISNRVYVMRFRIWADPERPGSFLVSWGIAANQPKRPPTEKYYYSGERFVAKQDRKRYDSMEAAQRYVQGRFDLYSHLFTELSPPVPGQFKQHFKINGCLLPGYTIAPPEQTAPDKEAVSELLSCLSDRAVELPETQPEQTPQEPQATVVRMEQKAPAPKAEQPAPEEMAHRPIRRPSRTKSAPQKARAAMAR